MRAGRAALATALAVQTLALARAEIHVEERGEEIVFTNLHDTKPLKGGRSRGPSPLASRAGQPASPQAPEAPPDIEALLSGAASRYAFDPTLIQAIVAAESSFDHMAVSKKGARGLMQLMPGTATKFGVRDVHDPAANLEAGVAYLRELVMRFDGDVTLALAAYNAGPEAVARYGGVPPYEETRDYIARIRSYYGDDLKRGDRSSGATSIRLVKVEPGNVPHFTNVRPRRLVRPGAPSARASSPRR